jgi:hypothetical protein
MAMEGLPVWAQGGIAGLTLAALVYIFLGMRSLFREFMAWSGNHMSEMTRAQVKTAESMSKVAEALDDLRNEVAEMRKTQLVKS